MAPVISSASVQSHTCDRVRTSTVSPFKPKCNNPVVSKLMLELSCSEDITHSYETPLFHNIRPEQFMFATATEHCERLSIDFHAFQVEEKLGIQVWPSTNVRKLLFTF